MQNLQGSTYVRVLFLIMLLREKIPKIQKKTPDPKSHF